MLYNGHTFKLIFQIDNFKVPEDHLPEYQNAPNYMSDSND